MVEVDDFDFTVQYAPGITLILSGTLSRNAIEKLLLQRCFAPIDPQKEENKQIEEVGTVVTFGALIEGPTVEQFRKSPVKAFCDPYHSVKAGWSCRNSVTSKDFFCFSPVGPGSACCLMVSTQLVSPVLNFVH